jgi:hypothetical protein
MTSVEGGMTNIVLLTASDTNEIKQNNMKQSEKFNSIGQKVCIIDYHTYKHFL